MPSQPGEASFAFAFTERETSALRGRIARDLDRIARRVAAADTRLRALVLTGGFSRGEGTTRGDAPVNDYDLVAIRNAPGGAALYAELGHALTREIGIEVDLLPIWSARLPYVGRKLFWLDLRLGGRTILGDPRALATLRVFGPEAIARAEIARLLGNRAAGMLLSLPAEGERADPGQRDLQATKAALAAMDATLLDRGLYAKRLRDRLALLTDHRDHAMFARAVGWKLAGDPLPEGWWETARDLLLRAVEGTHARDVSDGFAEHALHLLRAKRVRASPSRAIRLEAWRLLRDATWPAGPAGAAWGREKPAFFAARARTLQ